MNKEQLKKTLKPIIKECIREAILEEGILSSIISEVVKGTSSANLVENKQNNYNDFIQEQKIDEQRQKKLQENRRKMLDAIGRDAFNGVDVFQGTEPLSLQERNRAVEGNAGGIPQGARPLDNIAPNDPGVDLSSLGVNTGIWKKLAGK